MKKHTYDRVVFVMQGGGALGAYQVGVCEALLQFGVHPDWTIGTSIGAINAAIIAGNPPEQRVFKLKQFWKKMAYPMPFFSIPSHNQFIREWVNWCCATSILFTGVNGFFKPRVLNPWLHLSSSPDQLSYYDTSELRDSLLEHIDFDLINQKKTRLTVGSVNINTGDAAYFDNYRQRIEPEHIMASGALPPGFPAIKIGEEYYWDGGVISNTLFQVVLEEKIPDNLLCILINLFSRLNQVPSNMMDVNKDIKELEYASRYKELVNYYNQFYALQKGINQIGSTIKNNKNVNELLRTMHELAHPTSMNVARFHYTDQPSDLWSKDFNFSHLALEQHRTSGYSDAKKALKNPVWLDSETTKDLGVTLYDFL